MLDADPNNYVNDNNIELAWAIQASEFADVHLSLISAVKDVCAVRLHPQEDIIYAEFRRLFPDLNLAYISEEDLKTEEAKVKWREFAKTFSHIEEYNFGTLMRMDATKDYSRENTLIVFRIQFLAIESARNREGHNRDIQRSEENETAENK